MVTHFSYQITLLERCRFRHYPRFFVYRLIMGYIKRLTCLRSERNCRTCPLTDQCIYYQLSGENFRKYPAVTIRRNMVEQVQYEAQERIIFDVFLIGHKPFRGYVEGFFDQLKMIEKHPVYVQLIRIDDLDKQVICNRDFHIITPLSNIHFQDQLDYYHEQYETSFELTGFNEIKDKRVVRDQTYYRIDRETFRLFGVIGKVHIDRIDHALQLIGIGQTNFIGGGQLDEIKD
jgi:adenine-specific DNA glycosylase